MAPSVTADGLRSIHDPALGRSDRHGRSTWANVGLLAALAAGGSGAGILGTSAVLAYRMCSPSRSHGKGEQPAGDFEEVCFLSSDGLEIRGWFLPAPAPGRGVVLCHGIHTDRTEVLSVAQALRDRGYQVLLFDFRAHGKSQGSRISCGPLETRDLRGAVDYLLSRPEVRGGAVGVVGYSMGGAIALLTAAEMPEIGAVVADSAFASLREVAAPYFEEVVPLPAFPFVPLMLWFAERMVGIKADKARPMDAIGRIAPRPVLLIHGTDDRMVPIAEAYLLYESAGEPRELWTVEGAGHVEAREMDLGAYVERVDRFLKVGLSTPDTTS